MSKGTIVDSYGDGEYLVELNYERTKLASLIEAIEESIATTEEKYQDFKTLETQAYLKDTAKRNIVDAKISIYASDPTDEHKAELEEATAASLQAQKELNIAERNTNTVALALASLNSRKTDLASAVPTADPQIICWCADYTENLTGEVGVIDSGREDSGVLVIRPAGIEGTGAAYDPAVDGYLAPQQAMSTSEALYNFVTLPGIVKWSPLYRKGTITSVDKNADTCDVLLDAVYSTPDSIDVNKETALADVPIQYMNCNADPFEAGDRAIVAFTLQNWSQPVVIGFELNPKPCDEDITVWYHRTDGANVLGVLSRVDTREMLFQSPHATLEVRFSAGLVLSDNVGWYAAKLGQVRGYIPTLTYPDQALLLMYAGKTKQLGTATDGPYPSGTSGELGINSNSLIFLERYRYSAPTGPPDVNRWALYSHDLAEQATYETVPADLIDVRSMAANDAGFMIISRDEVGGTALDGWRMRIFDLSASLVVEKDITHRIPTNGQYQTDIGASKSYFVLMERQITSQLYFSVYNTSGGLAATFQIPYPPLPTDDDLPDGVTVGDLTLTDPDVRFCITDRKLYLALGYFYGTPAKVGASVVVRKYEFDGSSVTHDSDTAYEEHDRMFFMASMAVVKHS